MRWISWYGRVWYGDVLLRDVCCRVFCQSQVLRVGSCVYRFAAGGSTTANHQARACDAKIHPSRSHVCQHLSV